MVRQANATRKRSGALAVEGAVVYAAMFLVLLGLIVGGTGVFRYQQVACLANEATRWASVHGSNWQTDMSQPATTEVDIFQNAVAPMAAGMDTSALTIQVDFIDRAAGTNLNWDTTAHPPTSQDAAKNTVTNRVRVTVTYVWSPGALQASPISISSTSEMNMWY